MGLMEIQPYLTSLKDVVTAGVAVYAARIAAKGLTTWQRQFRGQQDFTLARQIALAAVKYQSALDEVRNPFIWFDLKVWPAKMDDARRAKFDATAGEYKKRWDAVVAERDVLEAAIMEGKVVWKNGAELGQLWTNLSDLEKELRRSVFNYLSTINPEAPQGVKAAADAARHKARDILYDMLEDEKPDSFKNEVKTAVQHIVDWLSPKLMR